MAWRETERRKKFLAKMKTMMIELKKKMMKKQKRRKAKAK